MKPRDGYSEETKEQRDEDTDESYLEDIGVPTKRDRNMSVVRLWRMWRWYQRVAKG